MSELKAVGDDVVDPTPAPFVTFKTTVDAKVLRAALTTVKPAMRKGSAYLPILSGVHLEATDGALTVTCADVDVSASIEIEASVLVPGVIVLHLADLVRLSKGKGDVAIVQAQHLDGVPCNEGEAVVEQDGFTTTVRTLPAEEWPAIAKPFAGFTEQRVVDFTVLRDIEVAISNDNARPILTAVCFNGDDVVATDSYRLHIVRMPEEIVERKFLMPGLVARQLAKLGGTGILRITEGNTHEVTIGNVTWHFTEVEGEFPNYKALIPNRESCKEIRFGDDFAPAVKGILARQGKSESIPIRIDGGSPLRLSMYHQDVARTERTVTGYSELDCTIAFNPAFLLEALEGTTVNSLSVVDGLKPAMASELVEGSVSGLCSVGYERISLLMPVRIS